ncbi:hypothetical protein Fmac_026082 [Flemingia macrophylla]|uniref:Protein kinase domain-containing protein n=1 Tax=Flemingia macrophylla TaxID=520843 RepID=A0ABD1LDW5_9FABA
MTLSIGATKILALSTKTLVILAPIAKILFHQGVWSWQEWLFRRGSRWISQPSLLSFRENGFHGGKEEREPGEICFEEHGGYELSYGLPPAQKKRKFSPIVWDLAEKEQRIASKSRISQIADLSPSRASLPTNPGADGVYGEEPSPDSDHVLPQSCKQDVDEGNDVQEWTIKKSRWSFDAPSPMGADDQRKHGKVSSSPELVESHDGSGCSQSTVTGSSGSSGRDYYLGPSTDVTDYEKDLFMDSMVNVEEQCNFSDSSSDLDESGSLMHGQRNINMLQSCRSVCEFEMIKKISEGTYGIVYKARDKKTGEIVALKKVKMNIERDGFPMSSLREINILLSFNHPSIVNVKEVVVDDFDGTFMVMEYMESDLKGMMEAKKQPFSMSEIKSLMRQLLEGVKYLHDNWVIHRDLKSSNILLNYDGELKICDFGLSRQYGSPLKPYTPVVVTLWYRAPELLLGSKEYSTAIDMWSVGCIMAELIAGEPLFRGKSELEQVEKKFPATSFTGLPVLSETGFDLLKNLLTYDPEKRITAEDALLHDWFHETPLPKSDFRPIFPSSGRLMYRPEKGNAPKNFGALIRRAIASCCRTINQVIVFSTWSTEGSGLDTAKLVELSCGQARWSCAVRGGRNAHNLRLHHCHCWSYLQFDEIQFKYPFCCSFA